MAAQAFSHPQRRDDLGVDPFLPADHPRVVHHLPQPRHLGPLWARSTSSDPSSAPGGLQARSRGDAAWRLKEGSKQKTFRLTEEQLNSPQAEDVGDLVGVGEHGRGPAGEDGLGRRSYGEHRALEVDVGVEEPGDEVAAAGGNDCGLGTDQGPSVQASTGDPLPCHSDIGPGEDVAPPAVPRHEVRRPPARGHGHPLGPLQESDDLGLHNAGYVAPVAIAKLPDRLPIAIIFW